MRKLSLILAVALIAAIPAPAHAAESLDACTNFIDTLPMTISASGTYCLRDDLLYTGIVSAIDVNVANVTIDCNGHRISGPGHLTVISGAAPNTTVRRCTFSDFQRGVRLTGDGVLIEDNRFDGMQDLAIHIGGDGSAARRNVISDTSGAYAYTPGSALTAILGQQGSGMVIADNVIDGVTASPGSGLAVYGIQVQIQDGAAIEGNRISGLVADAGKAVTGIFSAHGATTVRGNSLFGSGAVPSTGVFCGYFVFVRDNTVTGFATPTSPLCLDGGGNVFAD